MAQTQTQTQTKPELNIIKTIFQNIRKYLPMEAYKFKELVEERIELCEFWFDESIEIKKKVMLNDNTALYIIDEEFNDLICEFGKYTIIFKNSIYLDNFKNDKYVLVDYDVEVKESEQ
jgi:hypothetical protein